MVGDGYVLGPRIPMLRNRDAMDTPSPVLGGRVPNKVVPRETAAATTTDPCAAKDAPANLCEKPASGTSMALPIALGVAIPLVAIISVLLYLHFRVKRRLESEDARDPHKSLDFGLNDTPMGKGARANRKSVLGGREKDNYSRHRQMSMDLNLSNPYLLPPALHDSRESLHSLARTIHQHEDPYRPINQLMSDSASMRSPSRGPDGASIYSHESGRQQRRSLLGPGAPGGPPRQNLTPKDAAYRKPPPVLPPISTGSPAPSAKDPFRSPSVRSLESSPYPDEKDGLDMPPASGIQEPAPAAYRLSDKASPPQQPYEPVNELPGSVVQHNRPDVRIRSQQAVIHERGASAVELDAIHAASPPHQPSTLAMSPPPASSLPAVPQVAAPILEEPLDYYDDYAQMPEGNYEHAENHGYEEERGRTHHRESSYYEPEQHQVGLGIPQQDNHRLSVGFRPLPPDELMDTEDPETRANRIRSFYKEYFDDSKDANRQTQMVPPLPQQYQQHNGNNYSQGGQEYYEDYQHYHAGGADDPYYDPNANAFVMPYAQPVARRAMTPPPSGSRFQGQRAPPRGYHGSMGDMNMGMPGMRGPPRPGSSASRQFGGPPRPGTSQSGAWGRPRAGSSLSAYGPGRNGPPKKALPPPAALTTLPTPSKLKDDSFAIFNAADFAPPETFKDRVAGRSQSPMGERRPYHSPSVPVHSPLVNAFEEMPSLPSPHLLRKSSTFTGLDFAPPRKFVESDNRSETGSIRSNRSGISAVQLGAIRSGAGRVSKLPGDTIFTQAAMEQKLKPAWNMRD